MKFSGFALFPLVLVALLAALTFWLQRAIQDQTANRDGKGRHDPDFIIENFTLRRFDTAGTLQYTAVAPKMIHYADDDSSDLVAPTVTFHRVPSMQLSSRLGWMSKDGKEVRLSGDVLGVRAAGENSPESTVTSSTMTIFPDDETARSNTRTTLIEGHSNISGDNFQADNRQKTYAMSGNVNGILYRDKSH